MAFWELHLLLSDIIHLFDTSIIIHLIVFGCHHYSESSWQHYTLQRLCFREVRRRRRHAGCASPLSTWAPPAATTAAASGAGSGEPRAMASASWSPRRRARVSAPRTGRGRPPARRGSSRRGWSSPVSTPRWRRRRSRPRCLRLRWPRRLALCPVDRWYMIWIHK